MSVNLQLIFRTAGGSRKTISVEDPKGDLSDAQVQAAMDTILAKNIFQTAGGDLVAAIDARKVTTQIDDFTIVV